MDQIKLPSNKSFGLVFFVVFLLIAIYQYKANASINFVLITISLSFLFLGIINSKILTPLNKLWMKFGLLLGKIVNPIVLGLIFFGLFTPISFFMKLIRRDELNLKINKKNSNWRINNEDTNYTESFKRQF